MSSLPPRSQRPEAAATAAAPPLPRRSHGCRARHFHARVPQHGGHRGDGRQRSFPDSAGRRRANQRQALQAQATAPPQAAGGARHQLGGVQPARVARALSRMCGQHAQHCRDPRARRQEGAPQRLFQARRVYARLNRGQGEHRGLRDELVRHTPVLPTPSAAARSLPLSPCPFVQVLGHDTVAAADVGFGRRRGLHRALQEDPRGVRHQRANPPRARAGYAGAHDHRRGGGAPRGARRVLKAELQRTDGDDEEAGHRRQPIAAPARAPHTGGSRR